MKKLLTAALLVLSATLSGQSVHPGVHQEKIQLPLQGEIKAYAFNLADVRLLDSRFTENRARESKWILSLDANRLLHSFRTSAGVYAGLEGGYSIVKKLGGWEAIDCDLRGHSTGHILSGLAYLYASTGDEAYKLKSDSLVNGLAEVQNALISVGQAGYLSAYPQNLINRNIEGKSVWAPWYTLHKIYAGLIDQYLFCDNQLALEVVIKTADWAYKKISPLTEEQRRLMIRNEFGGVNEAFYNLYSITKNEKHKALAEHFYHNDMLDPLAPEALEVIDLYFKHANTFIPKLKAEARNYELHNNTRSKAIVENFWNKVVAEQTYCTGGNSHKEKFIHANKISENLTGYTQESCNTYNMLKVTNHLFTWSAQPCLVDYYERALYNHILGQQDPESGMVAYFLPLLPGAHKVYSTYDRSFWCCVGSGFENHAKYGEAIYYRTDKSLYVNLFIPSEVTWEDKKVKVCQETNFPSDSKVALTISAEESSQFALNLRYPSWAKNVSVRVNGKSVRVKQVPSSYIVIERTWSDGDRVEIDYPMHLYLAEANDNPNKCAIMYGPLVLAGAMGTKGMRGKAPFSDPDLHNDYYTYDYNVPADLKTSLSIDKRALNKSIKRLSTEPLVFEIPSEGIRLKPIHNIHRERYVVYWDLK